MRKAYMCSQRESDKKRGKGGRDETYMLEYEGIQRCLKKLYHLKTSLLEIDRQNYWFRKGKGKVLYSAVSSH